MTTPTPGNGQQQEQQTKQFEALAQMLKGLSVTSTRASIAGQLGKSFGGDRDIYDALGYTKYPSYEDYAGLYRRGDICKRIIDAPVKAAWFGKGKLPQITESEDTETAFERAWIDLEERLHVWHYLARADTVSRIGRYGVLLIGFDDGRDLAEPVERATRLLYLQAYAEDNAPISRWVSDTQDERYGQPLYYRLSISTQGGSGPSRSREVHHSRLIHFAEDRLESDIYGLPALEPILNRVKDLELILGGGAEGAWRGGFPGISFEADPDANVVGQNLTDLVDEIEDYMHGFKRYLRLQGITPRQLTPMVADLSAHIDAELNFIAGATGIPKRKLIGTEAAELASSQDERTWWDQIEERRLLYCEPLALRPFISRLQAVGILPETPQGYNVLWPSLRVISDREQAETGESRTRALATYVNALGSDMVVPPEVFLEDMLNFSKDRIAQIEDMIGEIGIDANDDIEPGEPREAMLPDAFAA